MNDLTKLVRETWVKVDACGVGGIAEAVKPLRVALAARGLGPNCHVGIAKKRGYPLTPEETVEWYAGSLLDIVDNEAWWCVNSWLNCVDKFAPETQQ
jgi:hypothetical protein